MVVIMLYAITSYSICNQCVITITNANFFAANRMKEGGQVKKPIILMKICYKLIQGVKNIFDKVTSWPQLISKLLVTPTCL